MEDTVHDSPDNTSHMSEEDMAALTLGTKVLVEDYITGHPACIANYDSLKQLAQYLILHISVCSVKDQISQEKCPEVGPFEINIRCKNTAAVVEWVSQSNYGCM